MNRSLRTIRIAVCLTALLPAAFASDWYVDAVLGDDTNSGTTPAQAWKTITHAVASTPLTGAQTIHVAPGTYDAALGEVFPWKWRPLLELVGDQGSASAIVVGTPGAEVIQMRSFSGSAWSTGEALIQGLTFQGGAYAISVLTGWNAVSPTLRDLAIYGASVAGIEIVAGETGFSFPVIENVVASGCGIGLILDSGPHASVTDCSFMDSTGAGIACAGQFGETELSLERCRIEGSGAWGLAGIGTQFSAHATTIVHNNGGVQGTFAFTGHATHCTIADNGSLGVSVTHFQSDFSLDSTIIYGHLDDVNGPVVAQYCDIGDGTFAGTNGNFQADPQFVNPSEGNYELLPGSPCIDAGNPAPGIEADCSLPDVGAYPFVHAQSQTYCTAKVNSCGGSPAIGAAGAPSATAGSGYVVFASGTKALASGLLAYSFNGPAAKPFQGGTLCLEAPVRRSVLVSDTSGTPGQCNGTLSIDMNAFAVGSLGGNPALALTIPGTQVNAQFWARDTPSTSLLSDALEYFVCP